MTHPIIARRLVFYIGGYDPLPPDTVYRRFVRELRRFEGTWSATASVSELEGGPDQARWSVMTSGPNWRVGTDYRLVRWDDIVDAGKRQAMWRRIPLGLRAFVDFVGAGALSGYLRTNWRYAAFFLYPFLLFAAFVALGWLAGALVVKASESVAAGAVAGLVAFVVLLRWPGQRLYLSHLFDDWIFSRDYIRRDDLVLGLRLDRIAREIEAAARGGEVDEILVVGHSLGAVLAIDLLDRALRLDPALGQLGPRVSFLTVGSSILKIGLHRGAIRLRAAVQRVAAAPDVFWAEYQALADVMNFYKTDPMAVMGLSNSGRPVVRIVRFRNMLDPAVYRRVHRNLFRMHCQFISANDRRGFYDYFMLLCGPLSLECQARSPEGAVSAIGLDGALLDIASDAEPVLKRQAATARQ